MKRAIDGATIHKIPLDSAFTLLMSLVSKYNQIIDKTEIRGIDAMKPPKRLFFFAISETSTIIPEEINTFMKYLRIIGDNSMGIISLFVAHYF